MQDGRKAVWSIPNVSVAFFPSLKQNFIAYRSSKVSSRPDCIFEIHQLWQSGFSRVYSNSCYRCWFEPEILKIGLSFHKMYCNNIMYFQESTTILNACTKNACTKMHHVLMAGGIIVEFITFLGILALCEMQTTSSRIWSRDTMSISYDDKCYSTSTSLSLSLSIYIYIYIYIYICNPYLLFFKLRLNVWSHLMRRRE